MRHINKQIIHASLVLCLVILNNSCSSEKINFTTVPLVENCQKISIVVGSNNNINDSCKVVEKST